MQFLFAGCRQDAAARRLFREGEEVHLPPKAFELLKLLIENHTRAMPKAELLERIWPDVFVSEASLAKVVNQIRDAVGDTGRGGIIRTVHGYGYAFDAPVIVEGQGGTRESRPGAYWLVCGSREFALDAGEHIIGRDQDADVCLESLKISRRHARVRVDDRGVTIEDLQSKNGTFVGRTRIVSRTSLVPGDEVRIGPFTLVLRPPVVHGSTETDIRTQTQTIQTNDT
jgi:DNA-binding winged helix-turn-helix (wHTH) protein